MDKKEEKYYDVLALANKIYHNSYECMWNDAMKDIAKRNCFYFYDKNLQNKISDVGKKELEKYKDLFDDNGECYVTKEAFDKFNEMLNDGKHTEEECYNYLKEEKNKLENNFGKSLSTKEIIEKYNEILHDGKHTFEQAYGWMMMEKNRQDYEFYLKSGMHLCNDYAFLYPESIYSYKENFD